jgi:hypothetical protein
VRDRKEVLNDGCEKVPNVGSGGGRSDRLFISFGRGQLTGELTYVVPEQSTSGRAKNSGGLRDLRAEARDHFSRARRERILASGTRKQLHQQGNHRISPRDVCVILLA